MKRILFILSLFMSTLAAFTQSGNVTIIRDPRIDALIKKQSLIIPPATTPQIPGYRIQLFFDGDRKKLDEARSLFISNYPKIDSYVVFKAPNYILKAGDFRTLLEAERVKQALFRDFPTSFIAKEMINLPRIDQN
jgi:hypothetical protein